MLLKYYTVMVQNNNVGTIDSVTDTFLATAVVAVSDKIEQPANRRDDLYLFYNQNLL